MGFGSILDLFKQDNWSNELVEMICEMLSLSEEMFAYSTGVIVQGEEDTDRQALIYDRDKRINKLERKIRRRVISRLSVGGSAMDIPSALIFMNVVKDAERMGDYVKNLHEVNDMLADDCDRTELKNRLSDPTAVVTELFTLTAQAFQNSDEEMAGKVIKIAKKQGQEYEQRIRDITSSDLCTNYAVCIVLILRFYKRLAAHMSNIATTVVMPVDMIDFYDE